MKTRRYLVYNALIIISLCAIVGCARYYNPTETTFPINESMVPAISGKGSITIKNIQTHGNEFVLVSQSGTTWKGDLGKWTDTAVSYLTVGLAKRNLIVTETAPKILKVSITDANAIFATLIIRCKLNLRVETGDGYTKEFEGNNTSPATLFRAADGAVMRAVVAALNDEEIITYLEK